MRNNIIKSNARNAQIEALETFSNAVTKLWRDSGALLERSGVRIETVIPEKHPEDKG